MESIYTQAMEEVGDVEPVNILEQKDVEEEMDSERG
jgi:hypothetical protein